MIHATPESSSTFSLAAARRLVQHCYAVRPWIYWCDFLASYGLGVYCYRQVRGASMMHPHQGLTGKSSQVAFFFASCLLFYRAAMFIHELVHQRKVTLVAFHFVWNLLCGIPFLIPSFVYYAHVDHHRRARYGTHADGEYLPLAHGRPWYVLYYLSWSLVIPIVVVVRFMWLSPAAWLSPLASSWIHRHASSLVMDPRYVRPLPPFKILRRVRLQELACFLWCWSIALVPPLFLNRWPLPFLVQAYLTAVIILLLNSIRTLGSHRWRSEGEELELVEQLVDSVNYPNWALVNELWAPVGLRFHALHHLFPAMPYHALPRAHRILMQHLPADSPYRLTTSKSLLTTLRTLLRDTTSRPPSATELPAPFAVRRSNTLGRFAEGEHSRVSRSPTSCSR